MHDTAILARLEPPYVLIKTEDDDDRKWLPSWRFRTDGVACCVRTLRGRTMRTKRALMDAFGAALQFFDGFAENWDALQDCLTNLHDDTQGVGFVLVVTHAEELLADDDGARILIEVLHHVGAASSAPIRDGDIHDRPALPFHAVLVCSSHA